MDARGGRDPMLAPILLEQRPQHLIDVLAVAAGRPPQNALFDGAELPERGVAAAVLEQHARFEPSRADRAEREGSDEADRFDENTGAARRRRHGAFPLRHFESRSQLSNLDK